MRIIRLANFVAPHSGGLRTSLAELGAGYLAAGTEISGTESTGPENMVLERVNLNVLSKPSGNLQLHECLPSARLKVRNRFSQRNEKT